MYSRIREAILLEMSESIDIDVLDTNDGSISVFIAGGRPLVDHDLASTVTISPSTHGNPGEC